jgi:hypothetical protein
MTGLGPVIHAFTPLPIGKKGVDHRTESGDDEAEMVLGHGPASGLSQGTTYPS